MGCCNSCDEGKGCEGCGGACGGNCDDRCGNNPNDVNSHNDHSYNDHSHDEVHYAGDGHNHGEIYNAVMGGSLSEDIKKSVDLWRDGALLFIRYQNITAKKGSIPIVVSVPFAPVMTFCQNLAMLHGKPGTRPSTVMGYAPILSLVTSQLASKKIVDDSGKKAPDASDLGPMDLSSLLKMIPGLTSMVGVYYDDNDESVSGLSDVASILMGEDDMGLSCDSNSPVHNTPACRRHHTMRGEEIDMGGCGCGTSVGGGCGCGVPCDGIQPNSPYMSEYHVTKRNAVFVPRSVQRTNFDWNQVERVNTQAQNNFGKVSHMDSSAAPVQVSGYYDEQVSCAKGGTCGKSCCGSH